MLRRFIGRTKKSLRRFRPNVDILEGRQLLASQFMMGHASFLTFTIAGNNTTPQGQPPLAGHASFDTAIGAQWLIQPQMIAQPSEWDPHPCNLSIAEVDYTTPNSLDFNGQVTSTSSNQTRITGATHVLPDWTFQDSFRGYVDEHAGSGEFVVDIKYNGHGDQSWTDDIFSIDLSVFAPKGTLNTTFPDASGPASFHFGIWQTNTNIAGQNELTNTPIDWADPSMLDAVSADPRNFKIGAQSPGPPAMNVGDVNFSANIQNTTPVDGYFSMNQVAKVDATTQDITSNNGLFSVISTYEVHSPKDVNGNQLWGRDAWLGSDMADFRLLVLAGDSATLTNPGKNFNYFDNPSTLYGIGKDSVQFLTFTDYQLNLETDLVWNPRDGMPIVISKQGWTVSVNEDNAAVRDNPTFANMMNPDNWVGHADMYHDEPVQNSPELMRPYQYNVPELLNQSNWNPTNLYWKISSAATQQIALPPPILPPPPLHDPLEGWVQMPDGHWWNILTGEGYQDGDVLT